MSAAITISISSDSIQPDLSAAVLISISLDSGQLDLSAAVLISISLDPGQLGVFIRSIICHFFYDFNAGREYDFFIFILQFHIYNGFIIPERIDIDLCPSYPMQYLVLRIGRLVGSASIRLRR